MAFFYQGTTPLILDSSSHPTFSQGQPLTVGFYPIIDGKIDINPSIYLCRSKNYVIRAGVTGLKFLGPSETPNIFNLVDNQLGVEPGNLIFFHVVSENQIIIGIPFEGIILNQVTSINKSYIITRSDDYQSVGYSTSLPSILNDCVACGCPEGSGCTDSGICQKSPSATQCNDSMVCGELSGMCTGTCVGDGYICTSENGTYMCVFNESVKRSNTAGTVGIILIFLLTLILIIGYIAYVRNKYP